MYILLEFGGDLTENGCDVSGSHWDQFEESQLCFNDMHKTYMKILGIYAQNVALDGWPDKLIFMGKCEELENKLAGVE